MKTTSRMTERWNKAWDKHTVKLVPYKFNKKFLEGANEFSRDVMRRAMRGVVHNNKEYDDLLMTVSEWGYCVETPEDFNFVK